MAKRKDGKETKRKILDVACDVFAEKGFRDAKITDICCRAGANVAAVNYYFGDKESLYVAAWRQVMERFVSTDATAPEDRSPEQRLRFVIHRFIRKVLIADHESGHFRRLELMELASPTGLIDAAWKELIAPRKQELLDMIRCLLGPDIDEDSVRLCEMSVVNQCRGYILLQKSRLEGSDAEVSTPERAERIAEHITRFSIAGIIAIRDRFNRP